MPVPGTAQGREALLSLGVFSSTSPQVIWEDVPSFPFTGDDDSW